MKTITTLVLEQCCFEWFQNTELKGYDWAKVALEDADTLTLLKNGDFDIEMSDSYIAKMMP